MTVTIDIMRPHIWAPPPGTQLRDFSDDFQRIDAGTLGSQWGMIWGYADAAVGSDASWPQKCAINPRIENGQCVWWSRTEDRDNVGRGYSMAWPQSLAWMTQQKFDQYAEVEAIHAHRIGSSEIILATVFSANAGSLDPDYFGEDYFDSAHPTGFKGQYGWYSMNISPNPDGQSSGFGFVYNMWGATPATVPDGLRGHAGVNYIEIQHSEYLITEPNTPPFPAVFRFETRWANNRWEFKAFINGQLAATGWDDRLLYGCPAMGGSAYYNPDPPGFVPIPDPNYLAIVGNFKGGMLPSNPPPPKTLVFPPFGTQVADYADDFHRPRYAPGPAISGHSLGPEWSVQWLFVDTPEPHDRIVRTNPSITDDGQCAFVANYPGSPTLTACWPLRLAWLSQGFFDHYVEIRMTEKPSDGNWGVYAMAAYIPSSGSRAYEPMITAQTGFFGLAFWPSNDPNTTSTILGFWIGGTTPEPGVPDESFEQTQTLLTLPDAPLGTLKRLEARWNSTTGSWDLRVLFDGVEVGTYPNAGELGQGLPAMGGSTGQYNDPVSPVVKVDYFKAGWLR